ncbi:hypothetical protein Tco_0833328 [Tanacetum coccineum]
MMTSITNGALFHGVPRLARQPRHTSGCSRFGIVDVSEEIVSDFEGLKGHSARKVTGEAGGEVGLAGNGGVSRKEGVRVAVICGLARCNKNDIDKAWEAVKLSLISSKKTFLEPSLYATSSVPPPPVAKPPTTALPTPSRNNKETAKKDIVSKKPELNDDMYNWIIAKYGTTNENWTDSQFESVADDVYITFFEKSDPPKDIEDIVKPEVGYVAKTTNLEADQDVLECSKKTISDEFDSSDESGSLEKSVSGSLKKSVSQKGPSKDLLKWYEDEKDKDEDEKDKEDDEIDEEVEDGKDDSDDELWSPKSIRTTSKSLLIPKMKRKSS